MRLLAIDFGTSNTVAALLVDGQAPRTVTFDASPLLPSAVYLSPDGQVTVGRDAQRLARLDPTRFEPNPKRRIDDGDVLLGDHVVPVVEIIAAVLRAVAVEVRRQLGGAMPDETRLTHPAQWGATRQNVLVSAARAAGLGVNLVLIPEPVAAAAQFTRLPGRTLPTGGAVAVYDLGGGTFDIAIVGRTVQQSRGSEGADGESQFHVLAEAGLPDLGGLDFDQAILEHVGRMASAADPGAWQQILRPGDASGRRAARALAEDVRAAKETLSRYPQTDISLPDPFPDAHLTRSEFEGLIRPNLSRSIELLADVVRRAGIAPDHLSGIFLVGGSSRIPLVAGLIQNRLHVIPVALDQPETAVALGALLVPIRRDGNRTVAIAGDTSPAARPSGSTGAFPAVSSPTGGHHGTYAPTGPSPQLPGPPPARPTSSPRRRPLLIAGALAVVVAVTVVLLVAKPFGSAPVADPTSTSTTPASTGSSAVNKSETASGSVGVTTGLGPAKAFSAGEMGFLGPGVNKLTNCGVYTAPFNNAVPATYRVAKVIRCQVAEQDLTGVLAGDRVFVYVVTASDGTSGAGRYLDQVVKDRKMDTSGLSKYDSDKPFTVGAVTGRVVTAYSLGPLSADPDRGASVLGWDYAGEPYVGLVVSLTGTLQEDLTNYWAQNYKPRG
jgi:Ethanolamine utilization protein EutJ (predicted chaperonin)